MSRGLDWPCPIPALGMHEVVQSTVFRLAVSEGDFKLSPSYGCVFAEPWAAWDCMLAQAQAFQPASGAAAPGGTKRVPLAPLFCFNVPCLACVLRPSHQAWEDKQQGAGGAVLYQRVEHL